MSNSFKDAVIDWNIWFSHQFTEWFIEVFLDLAIFFDVNKIIHDSFVSRDEIKQIETNVCCVVEQAN